MRFGIRPALDGQRQARAARRAFGRAWLGLCLGALVVGPAFAGADAAPGIDDASAAASASGDGAKACAAGRGEAVARIVQARYDDIRDLEAGFSQRSESATFAGEPLVDDAEKRGRVVFAKPGRMRWHYAAPDESVVVSDGDTLWIYDVAGATATRLEVTAGYLSGAALQFLLGDGQLLESFRVRAIACGEETVELDLVPVAESTYERLGLVADVASGDIRETSVVDLFGNRTVIRFEGTRVNQSPPAATFRFEPPAGVEVIDYGAGGA